MHQLEILEPLVRHDHPQLARQPVAARLVNARALVIAHLRIAPLQQIAQERSQGPGTTGTQPFDAVVEGLRDEVGQAGSALGEEEFAEVGIALGVGEEGEELDVGGESFALRLARGGADGVYERG